jgi:ATP-dependent Clp protease adaptor protein ClpS
MTATDTTSDIATVTRVAMKPPSKFNVVLYNDNHTTFEFVILILMTIFHKSFEEASALAVYIHENGKGIAGTYGQEIAIQKRDETVAAAAANQFHFKCEVEEA